MVPLVILSNLIHTGTDAGREKTYFIHQYVKMSAITPYQFLVGESRFETLCDLQHENRDWGYCFGYGILWLLGLGLVCSEHVSRHKRQNIPDHLCALVVDMALDWWPHSLC